LRFSKLSLSRRGRGLYEEDDRMKFILKVTRAYHRLMKNEKAYMEGEIAAIAQWVDCR
jgi:hypothetical protein